MVITKDLLAAYAKGSVSESERNAVRQHLTDNPEDLETVMMMMDDDYDIQLDGHVASSSTFEEELDRLLDEIDSEDMETDAPTASILPIMSRAARNVVDNLCAVRCEGYALRALGVDVSDKELEEEAVSQGLLETDGTALYSIGQLSAKHGLFVSRKYDCTVKDIAKSLKHGDVVIAVIDNSELTLKREESRQTDLLYGELPNHAIIIKSIDIDDNSITLLNPGDSNEEHLYPLDRFIDAWNDSSNYLIISNQDHYKPHPINLSEVTLDKDIIELREVFAENVHEVWAEARFNEGWTFGPVRDDSNKKDPHLLPYDLLSEREKDYCRLIALDSIKCLKKLGWSLVKDTKKENKT